MYCLSSMTDMQLQTYVISCYSQLICPCWSWMYVHVNSLPFRTSCRTFRPHSPVRLLKRFQYNIMFTTIKLLFLYHNTPLSHPTIASFALPPFITDWTYIVIIYQYSFLSRVVSPPPKFHINIPSSPLTMRAGRSTRPCGTLSLVMYRFQEFRPCW